MSPPNSGYELMLVDVIRELRTTMEQWRGEMAEMKNSVQGCELRRNGDKTLIPTKLLYAMVAGLFLLAGLNAVDLSRLFGVPVAVTVTPAGAPATAGETP